VFSHFLFVDFSLLIDFSIGFCGANLVVNFKISDHKVNVSPRAGGHEATVTAIQSSKFPYRPAHPLSGLLVPAECHEIH
jgi:hypothetical protein